MRLSTVVVTGIGLVSALGSDPAALVDPARRPAEWDAEMVSAARVTSLEPREYFSPRVIRRIEDYSLFAMVAVARALESAGLIEADARSPERVGLLLSTDYGPSDTVTRYMKQLLRDGAKGVSPNLFSQTVMNVALGYPSVEFDLRGVSSLIQGNDAMWFATRHIETRQADVVLCGGLDVLAQHTFEAYRAVGLVADRPDSCLPRDPHSRGLTMSEGCCILVLESVEHALKRGRTPLARVAGIGSTSDRTRRLFIGHKDAAGSGIAGAVARALAAARLEPKRIDAVFGCANGVPALDAAERAALADMLSDRLADLPVSSVKGRTGECFQAGWMMTAAEAVLSLDSAVSPATTIDGDRARTRAHPRFALCNGTSTNGANTSVVFESWGAQ